jgi:hypothetical protein
MLYQLGELERSPLDADFESYEGERVDWDSSSDDSDIDGEGLLKLFAKGLETRHDHFLPWDRRKGRVAELLADPENQKFCDRVRDDNHKMAEELDNGCPGKFAVAPHPDDVTTWYVVSESASARFPVSMKLDPDAGSVTGAILPARSSRNDISCAAGTYSEILFPSMAVTETTLRLKSQVMLTDIDG